MPLLRILKIPNPFSYSLGIFFLSKLKSSYLPVNCKNRFMPISFRRFGVAVSHAAPLLNKKKRLDQLCVERFPQHSLPLVNSLILQGKVFVDGKKIEKSGIHVSDTAVVEIRAKFPKFVSKGGYKLEAAIEKLGVDVTEKVALDSGISTGGFTDCLLQCGASLVYGVDVGYGQVAEKIRSSQRVHLFERTNLRYLSELPQKVDLVTLDLAFISILTVMPSVVNLMKAEATLVTLIKPQFEARKFQVEKGGIVRDPVIHERVRYKIIKGVEGFGFKNDGWIESPQKGADGNIEFLAKFTRTAGAPLNFDAQMRFFLHNNNV